MDYLKSSRLKGWFKTSTPEKMSLFHCLANYDFFSIDYCITFHYIKKKLKINKTIFMTLHPQED